MAVAPAGGAESATGRDQSRTAPKIQGRIACQSRQIAHFYALWRRKQGRRRFTEEARPRPFGQPPLPVQ